ncbi:hypothetical protein E2C01_009957 [Portunus trituberculatus]|uniref:Uncharacterized protein n=1 Tax=Portunus trituberculatus TaxID=210409 RepID=A0A5B7D732_PORTR|nr:hypothetical protein [Portunus trituberculatus]
MNHEEAITHYKHKPVARSVNARTFAPHSLSPFTALHNTVLSLHSHHALRKSHSLNPATSLQSRGRRRRRRERTSANPHTCLIS